MESIKENSFIAYLRYVKNFLRGLGICYTHFIGEDWSQEELSDSFKVTQAWSKPGLLQSEAQTLTVTSHCLLDKVKLLTS
jgi:hypothetical protein